MIVKATEKGELIRIIRPLLKKYQHEQDFMKRIASELTAQGMGTVKGLEWTPQNLWKFVRLNEGKFQELDAEERRESVCGAQIPDKDFLPVPADQVAKVLVVLTNWLKEWPGFLDKASEQEEVIIPVRLPAALVDALRPRIKRWEALTFSRLIVDLLNHWLELREIGEEKTDRTC